MRVPSTLSLPQNADVTLRGIAFSHLLSLVIASTCPRLALSACGHHASLSAYLQKLDDRNCKTVISRNIINTINTVIVPDMPLSAALPLAVATTLADGTTKRTTTTYDDGFTVVGLDLTASGFPYGEAIGESEFASGAHGVAGPTMRSKATRYWVLEDVEALSWNIFDRPLVSTITESGTNR